MNGFSIVICTHNPTGELLQRLLTALLKFEDVVPYEVVLVDNNSSPVLADREQVKQFLSSHPQARLLNESNPGLTPARITGIKAATYDWLIFFDDDNEPSADYLSRASLGINQYSQVGMWGPGNVEVIYTGNTEDWLAGKKNLFQQRNEPITKFDQQQLWQPCYPFGTGMVIKKEVAAEYVKRVAEGRYTLSDRKGKSLASGGDVQLVLTGINLGFYAGIIAGLSLRHLIDTSKSNLEYLRKQEYGTASAFTKAYNQVFHDQQIPVRRVTNSDILKKLYSLYRIYRSNHSSIDFQLLLASKLGELNAQVFASDQKKPFLLRLYEKMIHA